MAHPEDFPSEQHLQHSLSAHTLNYISTTSTEALYISMGAELILFTLAGAIVYAYCGNVLTTAPAYGVLIERLGKPAAALVLPTIVSCRRRPLSPTIRDADCNCFPAIQIIVGILYSLVTSRAVFFQIYNEKSIHRQRHTFQGWAVWISIVAIGWAIAFVIGESSEWGCCLQTRGP